MSRKSREWYPNVAMHIISRGNHRNDIFRDDEDYEFYIVLIEECIKYFNNEFQILGYILMSNHIHLQIQTKEKHIGFFMKRLNNTKPNSKYFPDRNRLISAWCKKLLVVEAGEKSGSLITAKFAKEQNRQKCKGDSHLVVFVIR